MLNPLRNDRESWNCSWNAQEKSTEEMKFFLHLTGAPSCSSAILANTLAWAHPSRWLLHLLQVRDADCCGLNKVGPIGSGTARKYGLVGVGVTLLEELCHCGGGVLKFQISRLAPESHSFFLLPSDPNVEFSVGSPAPGLLVCYRVSHRDDNGLNL